MAAKRGQATSGNFVPSADAPYLTSADMTNSMPFVRSCIRADGAVAGSAAVLPRRLVGQSSIPEPDIPVVSLKDPKLLEAVLDGLHRLNSGPPQ
jgi:hypothetical protein